MARNKKQDMEKYTAPFPSTLRKLIKERSKTQEELSIATGKTRQTVSQYVNGISEPGYDTLVKIADYFDVSLDYLLGRTAEPRRHPCAADELKLSPLAINGIRHISMQGNNETLDSILSDYQFSVLCSELKKLSDYSNYDIVKAKEYLSLYQNNSHPDKYAIVQKTMQSELAENLIEKHIAEDYPHIGRVRVLSGYSLVEYQKQVVIDIFRDVICRIANYEEFRKGFATIPDLIADLIPDLINEAKALTNSTDS